MQNATVTIEAPDWAFDGGFPEDMTSTNRDVLPDTAACVEPYVVDSVTGKECQIFQLGKSFFKVEI